MTMDKVIEKQKRPLWQWCGLAVVTVAAGWFGFGVLSNAAIKTLSLPAEQLIISTVIFDAFEDATPIRGAVQPLNSVFLDAVAGGNVEEILVEEGRYVEAGQPLVRLSNNELRLNVANTDTRITEQLNNLNNIINAFEATKLNIERGLIDTRYRIKVLERLEARQKELTEDALISQETYDATVDELEYQQEVLANIEARDLLEAKIRKERTASITLQIQMLDENQSLSQASFDDLLVRAPISGQLTSLPVEIGENKNRGERLGQIDSVDQYKVVAQVDEYYVIRVAPGQMSKFELDGIEYFARVDKVYPEIINGTFEVDLIFEDLPPDSVRRGQTLQLELTLGNPSDSLLLPLGGFIQDTGGNWVFIVDESGEYATRRNIRIGRRNNQFVEVREGLQEGDRVIISSYSQMADMERIKLVF